MMGTWMTRGHGLGVAVGIALTMAITAVAQEYSFQVYGPIEGLQNSVILSLAQDHAGYVWAGTEGGLYRYDGTRFRLMGQAEGLPCSTEVHGLFVASDGSLWVNTCARIFRFDGNRFVEIPGIDRLIRGAQVIANRAGGGVFITTLNGIQEVSRGADGTFTTRAHALPLVLAGRPMRGILRDGDRLWFGCGQQLCMEEASRVSVFGSDHGLPEDAWDGIQISPDGSVWVRSSKSLYRRALGQPRFSQEKPDIASSGFWGALTLGRDGSIMVPTDQGLAIHTAAGWSIVDRDHGLRNEDTAAVLEDREGSVWIGLAGAGLARWLGRGIWESWTTHQGLPSDIIWNIRRDRKGALWVATSLGLARIDSSGRTTTWTKDGGLGRGNVRWLAETADGSIWAAMKPGGLARIDPPGKVHRPGSKDGLPCDPADLFVDRNDRLWLPTGCGVFRIDEPSVSNRAIRVETPGSFGPSAWKVIEDTQGTIWISNGKALWSLREGQWRQHGRAEGLLTDNPYVMALASDGAIWLRHRYDAGIDRLVVSDGRIVSAAAIVPADPTIASGTAFHGFDAFGNFWRGTTNGVRVLHGAIWTTFTTEDGLISNDCDGEAFWADTDGGVWLGTSAGLAHYRRGNRIPPGPVIAQPSIVRLQIQEPARLVRAEFSSLNYTVEHLVRFAYRLDQGTWTDSVERNVSISGLGPGRHRLEVRCRVREGPFSPQTAATEFQLEPKVTETWWAQALAAAFMLAAIIQFVRWRLSAAVQRQAELEAIVATRTTNLTYANRLLDDKARELRRSEDRLKNAERLAHVGHWDWDLKSDLLSGSEEICRIFDLPQDSTPTYHGFLQAVVPECREHVEQYVSECLAKKTGSSIEFQITRPDGGVRIVACKCEVSLNEEGLPARLFGACQDVTDSRRAQQEDLARKKLESVGVLAGGIAHDFNNLLGGVLAQAEVALEQCAAGGSPKEELKAIRAVAIRGSEIVRQLMMYSGKEGELRELVDVSRVVAEMIELLTISVSKRARLITDLGSDLPPVTANAAQIRQIVMNLVTNASEAMRDRDGTIHVATRRVAPSRAETFTKDAAEGDYLQLEVSDTGCGMSPETRSKVFDPFYSTKGAGHGLGLAVVHGIVQSLGGTIDITSEVGRGTTIQVMLPCGQATTAEESSEPISEGREAARPSEELSVLVVEDEDYLRQGVVRMLRKAGFTVFEVANGTAAIDLLRAQGSRIDVILLDMTIPGASSHEVLAEAAHVRPDVRVILTSAYSQEMLTPPMSAAQIQGFIRKPYRLGDLVQTLRKAASA
jgi:signal transduction histidine kinase/ligand-binding sensor domain-containing protein/CheY-like chemotaxis protein